MATLLHYHIVLLGNPIPYYPLPLRLIASASVLSLAAILWSVGGQFGVNNFHIQNSKLSWQLYDHCRQGPYWPQCLQQAGAAVWRWRRDGRSFAVGEVEFQFTSGLSLQLSLLTFISGSDIFLLLQFRKLFHRKSSATKCSGTFGKSLSIFNKTRGAVYF